VDVRHAPPLAVVTAIASDVPHARLTSRRGHHSPTFDLSLRRRVAFGTLPSSGDF
jgi:hypothetical protein